MTLERKSNINEKICFADIGIISVLQRCKRFIPKGVLKATKFDSNNLVHEFSRYIDPNVYDKKSGLVFVYGFKALEVELSL